MVSVVGGGYAPRFECGARLLGCLYGVPDFLAVLDYGHERRLEALKSHWDDEIESHTCKGNAHMVPGLSGLDGPN